MKKIKFLLTALLLSVTFTFLTPNNAEASSNITIFIDGVKQTYSNKAIIENGNTLVPLRGIFEELGATVTWEQKTQTITATKENTTIWLKIGSKQTKVNGVTKTIAVPAKIVEGSTLVPLRFISESLGATVGWNQQTKTITITNDTITNYVTSIQKLKADQVEVKIKENATKDWPSDYSMQAFVIGKQKEAYQELVSLTITNTVQYDLIEEAFKDWEYNFDMVRFVYYKQLEAFNWIQNLVLDTDVKKQILKNAFNDWGINYDMVKFVYEKELEAYNSNK